MSRKVEAKPGCAVHSVVNARMAGDERRQQLVRVAVGLFSQHGFRGTTTKEIAAAAGVSEAVIFRHFATKEELYAAILDYKSCGDGMIDLPQMIAEALKHKNDQVVFESLAEEMLDHLEEDGDFLRLLLYAALEGHELAQMFWDRNIRQMYEVLGSYVRERQRDGALRNIDPLVVVRAFTGMIIHHSINTLLWDKQGRLLHISNEAAARNFTEILLSGIANKSNSKISTMRGNKKKVRASL